MTAPSHGASLLERYGLPPAAIEALSLRRVAAALPDGLGWTEEERSIAHRMVYACGDPGIAPLIRFHRGGAAAGIAALRSACRIITDVRMVATAVDRTRAAALGCTVSCALDRAAPVAAPGPASTRTAAALRACGDALTGAVVVVGNAPTALLALLDLIDAGAAAPALVIGTPVGFVAAAESKEELLARATPAIAVAGTRGGSAIGAAALNALLRLATGAPR